MCALFLTVRRFIRDCSGGPAIEAAVIFPLLVIIFFGLVEITNYLTMKERMNKAANQAA